MQASAIKGPGARGVSSSRSDASPGVSPRARQRLLDAIHGLCPVPKARVPEERVAEIGAPQTLGPPLERFAGPAAVWAKAAGHHAKPSATAASAPPAMPRRLGVRHMRSFADVHR